jgi:hypothetical protein
MIKKKIIFPLLALGLMIPSVTHACYIGWVFKNTIINTQVAFVLSSIFIIFLNKKFYKKSMKKYKYLLIIIPFYIALFITMSILINIISPLEPTTTICS